MSTIRTRILNGFEDANFGRDHWNTLLSRSLQNSIYLTWEWQTSWWKTCSNGELLLITAERDGEVVALAPLYTDGGMVFFVGSSFESDYLDFIGDIGEPEIMDAILRTAMDETPNFKGFRFYFVPDTCQTGKFLRESAERLAFSFHDEELMGTPILEIGLHGETAVALANKRSFRKWERQFQKDGDLLVRHLTDGREILSYLDEFYEQHRCRFSGADNVSRFVYREVCSLFTNFTRAAADTGWLRFTHIQWKGRSIAFHYGSCYRGRYFFGVSSFASDLARRSPGQVLMRHVLLNAIAEGAQTFDFGTGAHAFKVELSTRVDAVHTWGLYPSERRARLRDAALLAAGTAGRP